MSRSTSFRGHRRVTNFYSDKWRDPTPLFVFFFFTLICVKRRVVVFYNVSQNENVLVYLMGVDMDGSFSRGNKHSSPYSFCLTPVNLSKGLVSKSLVGVPPTFLV